MFLTVNTYKYLIIIIKSNKNLMKTCSSKNHQKRLSIKLLPWKRAALKSLNFIKIIICNRFSENSEHLATIG